MPATIQPFSGRTIGEKVLLSMDFSLNLASGETLVSSVWTIALTSGTDSGVGSRVSGAPSNSNTVASQLFNFTSGMTSGSTYLITCSATTSVGEVLVGYSDITITAAS